MPRREGRELSVGGFVALALLVLAVGIMAIGGESRVFSRKAYYRAVFQTAEGLRIGSPVKMAGVQVGTVAGVRLPTDPKAAGIEVRLGVEKAYAGRVREGSRAAIRFLQWLSGEKSVEITPGDPSKPPMPEDAVIPIVQETQLLEQGADIAGNLNDITVSLKAILEPLERGEGLLGQMLQDPEFGKEGLASLKASLQNLEVLTGRLKQGQGFAGRLFFDPAMASKADELTKAISDLAEITGALNRREGALGDLLKKDGSSQRALEDFKQAAASLRRTAEAFESTDGLIGRLLHDKEFSTQVAANLRETLQNLAEISRKVNSGQGSLGALVNERTLHDGLEDVIAGVNDSRFARWLLRHYQKKGIKAPEPQPPKP